MSVRDIPSVKKCVDKLNCEKIWFKGFTELELTLHINNFIKNSNFKYYFITSDDEIISPVNFELLKLKLNVHHIVSGWATMRQNWKYSTIVKPEKLKNIPVNIFNSPIINGFLSNITSVSEELKNIHTLPDEIESAFVGWFFTGMHRKIWIDYPFQTFKGFGNDNHGNSDLMFSKRILNDNYYKQIVLKKAFVTHLSNTKYPHQLNFTNKQIVKTF